ncbi:MAG: hypothetical protein GY861_21050 [bacterium]|nr:hypothetical protein [bacterium]
MENIVSILDRFPDECFVNIPVISNDVTKPVESLYYTLDCKIICGDTTLTVEVEMLKNSFRYKPFNELTLKEKDSFVIVFVENDDESMDYYDTPIWRIPGITMSIVDRLWDRIFKGRSFGDMLCLHQIPLDGEIGWFEVS